MEKYKSKDFYQTVILKTYGLKLVALERETEKFVTFIFDDPNNEAETILKEYWNRHLKLQARDLVENISELKTRIYSGV